MPRKIAKVDVASVQLVYFPGKLYAVGDSSVHPRLFKTKDLLPTLNLVRNVEVDA